MDPSKYTAKHPEGAAYDLTREEMVEPKTVRSLGISEVWVVRVRDQWVPIRDFLSGGVSGNLAASSMAASPVAGTTGTAGPTYQPEDADALWTPITVFSLALRLLGVLLFIWVVCQVISGLGWLLMESDARRFLPALPAGVIAMAVVQNLFLLLLGGYFIQGAPGLVRWAFPDFKKQKWP